MLALSAAVGLALVIMSVLLASANPDLVRPGLQVFLVNWIAVPYVVSGIVAWWWRPASHLGPLMLATGIAMGLTPLQWSQQPVAYSIGHVLDMLPAAMFLHVFLAFPTGRLAGRAERLLVIGGYGVAVGLQLAKIALGVTPENLLRVADRPAAAMLLEKIQLSLLSALLLFGAVVLFTRGRRSTGPRRRPIALLLSAFNLSLVMLAVLYVAGMGGWAGFEVIRNVTFAALGLAPLMFLLGLVDARLARADIGGLLVELRADPTADLQAPLARALHDPSLRLAYWLPEFTAWADQQGRPTTLAELGDGKAVRVVYRDAEPMAALAFDRSWEEEPELIEALAAAAGIALENGRLRTELRARLQDLHGSRLRVVEAGRQERQRLERNLHDGAQQRLVALSLELGLLSDAAGDDPSGHRLRRAKEEVTASLAELRDIARGIYPAVLSGHGLGVAVESAAALASIPVDVEVRLDERPPESVEAATYYVVTESLTNIEKHAAASRATVSVTGHAGRLTVEITDDGRGGAVGAARSRV